MFSKGGIRVRGRKGAVTCSNTHPSEHTETTKTGSGHSLVRSLHFGVRDSRYSCWDEVVSRVPRLASAVPRPRLYGAFPPGIATVSGLITDMLEERQASASSQASSRSHRGSYLVCRNRLFEDHRRISDSNLPKPPLPHQDQIASFRLRPT